MWSSELSGPEGVIAGPDGAEPVASVLVLSGSSGRVERERTALLAGHGVVAMSVQWFGGPGQAPGICEIPLETFAPALSRLSEFSDHLAVVGASKGAEAALLLATREPGIDTVIALSPPSVAWAGLGVPADGGDDVDDAPRSSWTAAGVPVPFVPYDPDWQQTRTPDGPAFRGLYEQSLEAYADRVPAATIPVERIAGTVVVSGGGDDRVWPSDRFAQEIADRRAAHGRPTELLVSPTAGHRVLLPGERPPRGGQEMARGGSRLADAALGDRVWTAMRDVLRLSDTS